MQQTSMPILNAESFFNGPLNPEAVNNNFGNDPTDFLSYGTQTMGYNFMPPEPQDQGPGQGQSQGQGQYQNPNQADPDLAQSGFSNGFIGMF